LIRKSIGISKKIAIETKNRTEGQVQGKTIPFSENNNISHSNLDSETVYSEYEEDKDLIQWQLPKAKKLPTLSSLVCIRCVVIFI